MFVEQMGVLFSRAGGTPMLGRMLGYLMVCVPEVQSAQQLAEGLSASAGSVSTSARQLVQMEMVERVGVPGSRAAHYRLRSDGWTAITRAKLGWMPVMLEAAERGSELMADRTPEQRKRIEEFRDFYRFMVARMPALLDEWEASRSSSR